MRSVSVVDYPGYNVFENGDVVGPKGKVLKPKNCNDNGYSSVSLYNGYKPKQALVHRLVAAAFLDLDLCNSKAQVNHKDLNKHNNSVNNLEIVTCSENLLHGAGHEDYRDYKSMASGEKVCRSCKTSKRYDEFYKNTVNNDGLHSYCKICVSTSRNQRKKQNVR